MGLLGLVVPWYVRVLAGLALIVSLFVGGAVWGVNFESDRRDAQAAAAVTQARKALIREVTKIEIRYVERAKARDAERVQVQQEVVTHAASIADPVSCWLDPDRVLNINRAWGTAPDPGEQARPVPAAAGAALGEPQRDRGVGDAGGVRVPGLR